MGSTALEHLPTMISTGSRSAGAGELVIVPTPVAYAAAWEFQSRLHRERLLDLRPDTLLILEHQPVYTLGRSTKLSDWGGDETVLRAKGADLHRVNRGGSVTFHGPGQIVVYPLLKVVRYVTGPRQLVRLLEEVIIRLLSCWEITGGRLDGKPGVWVMRPEPAKIASIGIRIEQGVSLHGFALNVDMDLAPFQHIHPCGFTDCLVTSMSALRNTRLPVDEIKNDLARTFGHVFGIEWTGVVEHPFGVFETADKTAGNRPSNVEYTEDL